MNIVDSMTHQYQVVTPTEGNLTGFHEDGRMITRIPLDGSDLGFGSNWVITQVNDKVKFHALNAPSVWSRRVYFMSDIRRHFGRY